MTSYGIVLYAVVALWLMPGAIWRPVAMALLMTWAVGEGSYYITGNQIPLKLYYMGDLIVAGVALMRRSHWSDLAVIPLIAAQWYWYQAPFGREQWMWLYFLTLAQMVACGPWPVLIRANGFYTHGTSKRHQGVQSVGGA